MAITESVSAALDRLSRALETVDTKTKGKADSVKLNGATYTPTNGIIDLGTLSGGGSTASDVLRIRWTGTQWVKTTWDGTNWVDGQEVTAYDTTWPQTYSQVIMSAPGATDSSIIPAWVADCPIDGYIYIDMPAVVQL